MLSFVLIWMFLSLFHVLHLVRRSVSYATNYKYLMYKNTGERFRYFFLDISNYILDFKSSSILPSMFFLYFATSILVYGKCHVWRNKNTSKSIFFYGFPFPLLLSSFLFRRVFMTSHMKLSVSPTVLYECYRDLVLISVSDNQTQFRCIFMAILAGSVIYWWVFNYFVK